ncbi:phytanoyl-CoA dioxygenase family protein [Sphingomonas sp.]|uniref:phytanoyl-CoA dioxygenase family protein n=1 Tax=Sphingomonas sp. TaxID=28214 RepID=UPI003D6CCA56
MTTASDLISEADRESFRKNGAAVIRGVVEPELIDAMRVAIDEAMADGCAPHYWLQEQGDGAFYNGLFHWIHYPAFASFVQCSRLGEVAAALLDAERINFFYDHLFVKEAGSPMPSPWHTDAYYHPVVGGQVLTIWTPFDRVTPESGSLTYIAGSHLWSDEKMGERLKDMPTPGEAIEGEQVLTWTLEPGDILVHDARTVHGAPGNLTRGRRRALATRWLDQDTRYQPVEEDLWAMGRKAGNLLPEIDVAIGQPFDSKLFPQVWPR